MSRLARPAVFSTAVLLAAALLLAGCVDRLGAGPSTSPDERAEPVLTPARFSDLPGWAADDHGAALAAFQLSCGRMLKKPPAEKMGAMAETGTYGAWQSVCRKAQALQGKTGQDMMTRRFFEENFRVYRVGAAGGDGTGLFTGYYESALSGSRTRGGRYQYPLRARPDDLVMVDLGLFRDELKGQHIAGRVTGGQLKPYETHAQIERGGLPAAQDKPLLYVDNPVDAFFIQIQGSGRVNMDDGTALRLGYDGQNGHPYYAIGRELVKRGALRKEDVSMQSIRAWLEAHPGEAGEIMHTNKSYVFFRVLDGHAGGPLGGEGVPLTAGRSLAVDRSKIPYGAPLYVSAEAPSLPGSAPIRRLMVAQDTGGAIRGPVRGDIFFGYGGEAERLAGHMKGRGSYWMLAPK